MLPHASEKVPGWLRARELAGRMLVALDFDGTLTPIVDRPDAVAMPEAGAAALERLAARRDTLVAVVSGRGLADVEARVGVAGIYYVGNHGMEIRGPALTRVLDAAREARPRLAAAARELGDRIGGLPGVILEDKTLTLSVHYRLAADEAAGATRDAVRAVARDQRLRVTEGKKVLELRPDVDWHKGSAIRFLVDTVMSDARGTVPVLFVGDDATDEDAFREIRGWGDGVLVSPEPRETAATSFVRSPVEVVELLERLANEAGQTG